MTLRLESELWLVPFGAVGLAAALGILIALDPLLAVLTVLVIAFVALTLANVTLGFYLFAFLAFLEVVPGIGDLSAAKLAGAVLALSWLATVTGRAQAREQLLQEHPVFAYVAVVFVVWSAGSALWAEVGGESLYSAMRYGLNLALVPIAFTAIHRRSHAFWFAAVFMAGALLSTVYGLVISPGDAEAAAQGRLSGAGVDPNYLATALIAALALAAATAATRSHPPRVRLAALGVLGICVVAVMASVSRTGLVALGAVMLFGVLLPGPRRRGRLLGLVAAGASCIVLYFAAFAPDLAVERITHPGGGTGRTDIWTVGWRVVEAEPVLGVGAGNFPVSTVHFLLEPGALDRSDFIVDDPKVAHNVYLETLAEVGIVGLALLLGIMAFLLWCGLGAAWRFRRLGDDAMELLARGTVVAGLAMLVGAFFNSLQYSKPLWLMLAFCPALLAIARRTSGERAARPPG